MITPSLDGTEEFQLIPLVEIEQREAQGWKLWKCPKPPLDDDDKDKRHCNFPQDVKNTDQPHKDTEFYFAPEIIESVKTTAAPSGWEPGLPLEEGYEEEENISTAQKFRPSSEWKGMVTGTSSGHFPKIRRPRDISLGWGGYD